MKYAQDFIQSYWAIDKEFENITLSQIVLDKLLKGELKTIKKLRDLNNEDRTDKNYTIFFYNILDDSTKKTLTIIDSIFINDEY